MELKSIKNALIEVLTENKEVLNEESNPVVWINKLSLSDSYHRKIANFIDFGEQDSVFQYVGDNFLVKKSTSAGLKEIFVYDKDENTLFKLRFNTEFLNKVK